MGIETNYGLRQSRYAGICRGSSHWNNFPYSFVVSSSRSFQVHLIAHRVRLIIGFLEQVRLVDRRSYNSGRRHVMANKSRPSSRITSSSEKPSKKYAEQKVNSVHTLMPGEVWQVKMDPFISTLTPAFSGFSTSTGSVHSRRAGEKNTDQGGENPPFAGTVVGNICD